MTLAAIMVTVDFDPASKARIKLAADLARRFGSLLIGVAGWPLLKRPGEKVSDNDLAERAAKELQSLGESFRKIAEEVAVRVEWRSSMDFPREVIPKEARAADLVVIGQSMLPGDRSQLRPRNDHFGGRPTSFGSAARKRSSRSFTYPRRMEG